MSAVSPNLGTRLVEFLAPGAVLLDDVRSFIRRFCVLPDEHCLVAVSLWVAHSHLIEHFYTTPRIAALSPEPESGKTRLLEVLSLLASDSLPVLNASPATIFRSLAVRQRTLLFDEADTVWKNQGKDDNREDLRALLNAGYKRGAKIPRCVGPQHGVVDFDVFAAVALAGIGDCLPETVLSRSIILKMRRRAPEERLERFIPRKLEAEAEAIRKRVEDWASLIGTNVGAAEPTLPIGIADRQAEIWEPLVAIADQAGAEWPRLAREACEALCKVSRARRASLGVRLLSDLKVIFGDAIALHTQTIVDKLIKGDGLEEDAPWSNLRGQPVGKRGLATLLAKYEVRPRKVNIGGVHLQGYRREDLWDAWQRYLPHPSGSPEPAELAERNSVPEVPDVPDSAGGMGEEFAL
jgi:hypothetical protein